jgi:hypothetical protein
MSEYLEDLSKGFKFKEEETPEEVPQSADENSQHSLSMNKKIDKDKLTDPQKILLLAKIFQGKCLTPTKIAAEFESKYQGFSRGPIFKKIRDISEVCFFVTYEVFSELVKRGLRLRKLRKNILTTFGN